MGPPSLNMGPPSLIMGPPSLIIGLPRLYTSLRGPFVLLLAIRCRRALESLGNLWLPTKQSRNRGIKCRNRSAAGIETEVWFLTLLLLITLVIRIPSGL